MLKIVEDIDAGNTNLNEEEAIELTNTIVRLVDRN